VAHKEPISEAYDRTGEQNCYLKGYSGLGGKTSIRIYRRGTPILTDNISIPLAKDTNFDITPEYMQELTESFPDLNVKQELKLLAAWNQANPRRRKTLKGICRHINSWLSHADKNVRNVQAVKSDNVLGGSWFAVAGAYFRPLSPPEVRVWESEMAESLNPSPDDQEIIRAIRKVVSCPQGKPQYLNAWDIIKAIRLTRKAVAAAELTEAEIQTYVASIKATAGLEARWDMICEHPNPMRVEEACNQAGIPFSRPQARIREAQAAADGVSFRML